MAFLLLIFKSAFRNRLRTTLTSIGVAIVIVAFLFLRTFIAAWYAGADAAAVDRLIIRNKTSLTFPLPMSHMEKIKRIPGVADISYANWFGGVYKDPKDFFANFATEPEGFLRMYPEFILPEDQKKAYLEDRRGAIAGDLLAQKYGWKVGDKIVLKGSIYAGDFEFTIRGIYTGREKNTDRQQLQFHWKYLDETLPETRKNNVGWFVIKVNDPSQSGQIATLIDQEFSNSIAETRSESEKSFQMSFLSMASAVIVAIQIVSGVILAILMLILGNTLAMAARERTTEYAVMRAIGFQPSHIIKMVIGEGFVVALVGVVIGVGIAPPVLKWFADFFQEKAGSFLGAFELAPQAIMLAVGIALLGGIVASIAPALRAGRINIVDALRRIE